MTLDINLNKNNWSGDHCCSIHNDKLEFYRSGLIYNNTLYDTSKKYFEISSTFFNLGLDIYLVMWYNNKDDYYKFSVNSTEAKIIKVTTKGETIIARKSTFSYVLADGITLKAAINKNILEAYINDNLIFKIEQSLVSKGMFGLGVNTVLPITCSDFHITSNSIHRWKSEIKEGCSFFAQDGEVIFKKSIHNRQRSYIHQTIKTIPGDVYTLNMNYEGSPHIRILGTYISDIDHYNKVILDKNDFQNKSTASETFYALSDYTTIEIGISKDGETLKLDELSLENKAFPTSYISSSRGTGKLTMPTSRINLKDGILSLWVETISDELNGKIPIFYVSDDFNGYYHCDEEISVINQLYDKTGKDDPNFEFDSAINGILLPGPYSNHIIKKLISVKYIITRVTKFGDEYKTIISVPMDKCSLNILRNGFRIEEVEKLYNYDIIQKIDIDYTYLREINELVFHYCGVENRIHYKLYPNNHYHLIYSWDNNYIRSIVYDDNDERKCCMPNSTSLEIEEEIMFEYFTPKDKKPYTVVSFSYDNDSEILRDLSIGHTATIDDINYSIMKAEYSEGKILLYVYGEIESIEDNIINISGDQIYYIKNKDILDKDFEGYDTLYLDREGNIWHTTCIEETENVANTQSLMELEIPFLYIGYSPKDDKSGNILVDTVVLYKPEANIDLAKEMRLENSGTHKDIAIRMYFTYGRFSFSNTRIYIPSPKPNSPIFLRSEEKDYRRVYYMDNGKYTLYNKLKFIYNGDNTFTLPDNDILHIKCFVNSIETDVLYNNGKWSVPSLIGSQFNSEVTIEYIPSYVFCAEYDEEEGIYEIQISNTDGSKLTVEYEVDGQSNDRVIETIDINPIKSSINDGFIYLTDKPSKVEKLDINVTPSILSANGFDRSTIIIDLVGKNYEPCYDIIKINNKDITSEFMQLNYGKIYLYNNNMSGRYVLRYIANNSNRSEDVNEIINVKTNSNASINTSIDIKIRGGRVETA